MYQNKIREFMEAFGQYPVQVTPEILTLREKLVTEEFMEYLSSNNPLEGLDALADLQYVGHGELILLGVPEIPRGLLISAPGGMLEAYISYKTAPNIFTRVEALYSLLHWAEEHALMYGFDLQGAFDEVHRSNMSKLGSDGKPIYREDGKVLKGPNYSPPNLEPFLKIAA